MNRRTVLAALAALSLAGLGGCTLNNTAAVKKVEDVDIVAAFHQAADQLIDNLNSPLAVNKPIITASFVNIDRLTDSSSLGRMASEHVASRLAQRGFHLVEMKLRDSVFIKEGAGEFVLSREVKNLSREHDAQAVVAGTYAAGYNNVYFTVRLVRTTDSKIIAAYDFALPMGRDTRALVRGEQRAR